MCGISSRRPRQWFWCCGFSTAKGARARTHIYRLFPANHFTKIINCGRNCNLIRRGPHRPLRESLFRDHATPGDLPRREQHPITIRRWLAKKTIMTAMAILIASAFGLLRFGGRSRFGPTARRHAAKPVRSAAPTATIPSNEKTAGNNTAPQISSTTGSTMGRLPVS